jgi:hypothetical protein
VQRVRVYRAGALNMSFRLFFELSTGLTATVTVPHGTLQRLIAHVEEIERTLKLKRVRYKENPAHWDRNNFSGIPDELLCKTVDEHNRLVIWFYQQLLEWNKTPVADGEPLTPEDAQQFWHGLTRLNIQPHRWTREYYVARMESLYEVMRGRESDGVTFDEKALTPKQAAAVVRVFDQYLDKHDMRLEVPNGHDHLASSYDGGYHWCEKCGPMKWDDAMDCKRRKCPLIAENRE